MRNQFNSFNEEKNQFMTQPNTNFSQYNSHKNSNEDMQKMFLMFQKMATDPSLFMRMMSSVRQKSPQLQQRKRQYQVQQHKYRNHEVSPRRKEAQSPPTNEQFKGRGRDVVKKYNVNEVDNNLQKYFPNQSEKYDSLAQSNVTVSTKDQHLHKFEEKPIETQYTTSLKNKKGQQNNEAKAPKYNAEDDRPIKPAKGFNYESQGNQSVLANNSSILQEPANPSKYIQSLERPIKGIQGDFNNYVMKQQGFPVSQYPPQDDKQQSHNQEIPKARTFLKRGSRQHLSSAIDRSVQKTNTKPNIRKQEDLNSSNIDNSEKPERSISQNRVLGRKSVSSKSIAKKPAQKQAQDEQIKQKKTLQYSNTTSNYTSLGNQGRTSRVHQKNSPKGNSKRQQSSSPTFNQDNSYNTKKPEKKNIFKQQSSDEESNQQGMKNNKNSSNLNKTEVVPGVYLTKKQLHQILNKFSKSNQPTAASSETEIQDLKSKYIELCNVLTEQKQLFQVQMQKQKEQFQAYKQSEISKIKNERKVQERNQMNTQKNKQRQKQKQQYESLKKLLQKEREEFKHKQKNYKIMIEKYKKMAEQKQKSSQTSQYKGTAQDNGQKNEDSSSTANKRKNRITSSNVDNFAQNDEVNNSYKGSEQNFGYNNNKKDNVNIGKEKQNYKDNKDNKDNKDKQKLPNYQDLKKPNSGVPPKSSQISHQNVGKNKKYEYYEQFENKETLKEGKSYNSYEDEEQPDEKKYQSDTQQIVEYNPSMKLSDLTKIDLNIKMVTDQMIENLFRYQNNPEYRKYLEIAKSKSRTKIHTSRNAAEKKTTNVYADGGKEVIFDTGVRKQYFNNGYVIIFFSNGDIKQKLADETVLYFYRQKQVDQITLPNKINIFRFDNNQVQFHFQDQSVQIRHPDGTFKIV